MGHLFLYNFGDLMKLDKRKEKLLTKLVKMDKCDDGHLVWAGKEVDKRKSMGTYFRRRA